VLVFDQKYDPKWQVYADGLHYSSLAPTSSLVNGYFFGPGHHVGSLVLRGRSLALTGVALSILALFLLIAIAVVSSSRLPRGAEAQAVVPQRETSGIHLDVWQRHEGLIWPSAAVVATAAIASGFSFGIALAIVILAAVRLRARWWLPWAWALAFVCLMPLYNAMGQGSINDNIAVVTICCMVLALFLLMLEQRRKESLAE
jgi:hypothetical protein